MNTAWRILNNKISNLEKQQKQRGGAAQSWDWYENRVYPSIPPSTVINVRGGRMWVSPSFWAESWYNEDASFDLSNTAECFPSYTFTNPNWYLPVGVTKEDGYFDDAGLYLYGPDHPDSDGGGFVEYETATEAENAIDSILNDGYGHGGNPICQLILRNNGNVSLPNQFMPIDQVNRGRSYFYGDIRKIYRF